MDSYTYYVFPKCQTQKLLTKYSTEEKNKHIICRPRSVRIGKNCALGLEYGLRAVTGLPASKEHTVHTELN